MLYFLVFGVCQQEEWGERAVGGLERDSGVALWSSACVALCTFPTRTEPYRDHSRLSGASASLLSYLPRTAHASGDLDGACYVGFCVHPKHCPSKA